MIKEKQGFIFCTGMKATKRLVFTRRKKSDCFVFPSLCSRVGGLCVCVRIRMQVPIEDKGGNNKKGDLPSSRFGSLGIIRPTSRVIEYAIVNINYIWYLGHDHNLKLTACIQYHARSLLLCWIEYQLGSKEQLDLSHLAFQIQTHLQNPLLTCSMLLEICSIIHA